MNESTAAPSYKRHRFPPAIIGHAVWLYFRFALSYRDVEELLAERGVIVTYETIRKWCQKFGQAYANAAPASPARWRYVAPGRGLRFDQRRAALPLAGRRPGRHRARHPRAVSARQAGGGDIPAKIAEGPGVRAPRVDHRQAGELRGGAAGGPA